MWLFLSFTCDNNSSSSITTIPNILFINNFRSSQKTKKRLSFVLRNLAKFTEKHQCQCLFFSKVAIKKETLALVLSCEFCEISKNNFFYATPPVAVSVTLFFIDFKFISGINVCFSNHFDFNIGSSKLQIRASIHRCINLQR